MNNIFRTIIQPQKIVKCQDFTPRMPFVDIKNLLVQIYNAA